MRRAFVVVLFAVGLAACARPEADPLAVGDGPRRIVSLTPALTEILFALDLGERVVGVTDYCDQPAAARTRPRVGGYANPSVEAILALRPDLVVVTPGPGNREAALAVRRSGVAVAVFRAETLQETLDTMGAVGERCGEVERARSLVESLRKRLDDVSRRVAGASRTRVLFALQTEPIIASGRGTLPSDLLELAGGENVVTEPRYPRLSLEAVLESSPDVIVQSRMDVPENRSEPPEIRFWERWPELPAVRDRRVHLLVGDAPLRPGPRVAEAAEQLAAILHPEAHP